MRFNTIFTPKNISEYKKIADISKELLIPLKPATYTYPSVRLGGENRDSRFTPEEAAESIFAIDEYRFEKDFFIEKTKQMLSLPEGSKEKYADFAEDLPRISLPCLSKVTISIFAMNVFICVARYLKNITHP